MLRNFLTIIFVSFSHASELQQIPAFVPARMQSFNERAIVKAVLPASNPLVRPIYPKPQQSVAKIMGLGFGLWGIGHSYPYVLRLITGGFSDASDMFCSDITSNPGSILKFVGAGAFIAGAAWYAPRRYMSDLGFMHSIAQATTSLQDTQRSIMDHVHTVHVESMRSLHGSSYSVAALTSFYDHYLPTLKILDGYRAAIGGVHAPASSEEHKKTMQSLTEMRMNIDAIANRVHEQESAHRALLGRMNNPVSPRPVAADDLPLPSIAGRRASFDAGKSPLVAARRLSVSVEAPEELQAPISSGSDTNSYSPKPEARKLE